MTIGCGIFLGLATMALAYLFVQTKDRWRWRSIFKWLAAIVATPIALVLLWQGYEVAKEKMEARPSPITRYADISLGDRKIEVQYAKGQPTDVLEDDTSGQFPFPGARLNITIASIPKGKHASDYQYWDYETPSSGRIDVDFSPKSQRVVRILCYASEGHPCPLLLGIGDGATEDDVVSRLGAPSGGQIVDEFSAVKTLSYPKWNVAYLLEKRHVYGLQVEFAAGK